jgi:hypothetical protein
MSRFGCVRWMGWGLMACSLVPLSVRAEAANVCSIERGVGGTLYPNAPLATRLQSNGGESFFVVKCKSASSGVLRLSIDAAGTNTHGSLADFRLVDANQIFAMTKSEYTDGVIRIPYKATLDQLSGELYFQVRITAPENRFLSAAKDYEVRLNAEFISSER